MKVVEMMENVGEDMAGAQDTIYLCNFRVSVDGEWLCLKELHDVDYTMQESQVLTSPSPEIIPPYNFGRDPVVIERSNLVNISKLVVKELIEQSLRYGRMLDSDHMPLQHFFIVLEHVLRHGLRPKKGLLGPKKELWDILQTVEKYAQEAQDITSSVRDLPTVNTHMGRARAWLRLALMQKKLADYLKVLIDHKEEALAEYFEPDALMLSDEAIIIIGLLVGLNVIDCNLCVKEEDLDCPQGVIDFSLYLRSSNQIQETTGMEIDGESHMTTVLDQKNYIEELNRHLNATVTNLQTTVESLTTTNALMKEDLAIAKNNLLGMFNENKNLRRELGKEEQSPKLGGVRITNVTENNVDASEASELKQRLDEERKLRFEADKELQLQMDLKAEMEVAMKLLEKDIHEKQDTIISLRRQLDDIKLINLEMYKKLQECEMELTQKGEVVSRLQAKASQIGKILTNLERFNLAAQDKKRTPTSDRPRPFVFPPPPSERSRSFVLPTPAPRTSGGGTPTGNNKIASHFGNNTSSDDKVDAKIASIDAKIAKNDAEIASIDAKIGCYVAKIASNVAKVGMSETKFGIKDDSSDDENVDDCEDKLIGDDSIINSVTSSVDDSNVIVAKTEVVSDKTEN